MSPRGGGRLNRNKHNCPADCSDARASSCFMLNSRSVTEQMLFFRLREGTLQTIMDSWRVVKTASRTVFTHTGLDSVPKRHIVSSSSRARCHRAWLDLDWMMAAQKGVHAHRNRRPPRRSSTVHLPLAPGPVCLIQFSNCDAIPAMLCPSMDCARGRPLLGSIVSQLGTMV